METDGKKKAVGKDKDSGYHFANPQQGTRYWHVALVPVAACGLPARGSPQHPYHWWKHSPLCAAAVKHSGSEVTKLTPRSAQQNSTAQALIFLKHQSAPPKDGGGLANFVSLTWCGKKPHSRKLELIPSTKQLVLSYPSTQQDKKGILTGS